MQRVCRFCKQEIESHDGAQAWKKIYVGSDDVQICDYCFDFVCDDEMYEIGGTN